MISIRTAVNPVGIRTKVPPEFRAVALPLHQSARRATKDELKSVTDKLSQTELETVGAVNQLLDMYMCCALWVSWLEVIYWQNVTAPCFFIIIYECNPYGQPWLNYTSTNIIHHTPYKTQLKSFKSGRDYSVGHGGMQDTGETFFFFFSYNIQSVTSERYSPCL